MPFEKCTIATLRRDVERNKISLVNLWDEHRHLKKTTEQRLVILEKLVAMLSREDKDAKFGIGDILIDIDANIESLNMLRRNIKFLEK